jgi:hypothetical protein
MRNRRNNEWNRDIPLFYTAIGYYKPVEFVIFTFVFYFALLAEVLIVFLPVEFLPCSMPYCVP